MDLAGRSIVSIDDLSTKEMESIFELTDKMEKHRADFRDSAHGRVLATLFHEPSTRTRLSFEAAMQRLGGGTISAWDMNAASVAKGERLSDTIKVVSGYGDIIVLRHPWEGAAQLAAQYSSVPVINAGDGGHEHPTQTLLDLYTLRRHYGKLSGLTVALCGDLQNGRTIHSLAFALARFGAGVVFVPGDGKEVPAYVLHRLKRDFGARIEKRRLGILAALYGRSSADIESSGVNAIYMTPTQPHQLALNTEEGARLEFRLAASESLSIYVTRLQAERDKRDMGPASPPTYYPKVTAQTLKGTEFRNISILHPLPRVDEVSPEIDQDPRSLYFEQSAYGLPVRMALLWSVLGLGEEEAQYSVHKYSRSARGPIYDRGDFMCANELCVTYRESQFCHKRFEIVRNDQYMLRCLYCDQESKPAFVGNIESRIYYDTQWLDRFKPPVKLEHVRFFGTAEEAEKAGFRSLSRPQPSHLHIENGRNWVDVIMARAT